MKYSILVLVGLVSGFAYASDSVQIGKTEQALIRHYKDTASVVHKWADRFLKQCEQVSKNPNAKQSKVLLMHSLNSLHIKELPAVKTFMSRGETVELQQMEIVISNIAKHIGKGHIKQAAQIVSDLKRDIEEQLPDLQK